ncbi:MAG: hypothetical protein QXP36_08930 [Conexivisphaerales archaeon]
MKLVISFNNSSDTKPWVARITGLDPKYGLKREFVRYTYDGNNAVFEINDGYYDINDPFKGRSYIHVINDKQETVSKDDVIIAVAGEQNSRKAPRYRRF